MCSPQSREGAHDPGLAPDVVDAPPGVADVPGSARDDPERTPHEGMDAAEVVVRTGLEALWRLPRRPVRRRGGRARAESELARIERRTPVGDGIGDAHRLVAGGFAGRDRVVDRQV